MIYSFSQEKVVRSSSGNSEFPISVLLINFGEKGLLGINFCLELSQALIYNCIKLHMLLSQNLKKGKGTFFSLEKREFN